MARRRHPGRAPEISSLLELLAQYEVESILVGSVAALAYGVEVTPGDLDIVPATDRGNLARLVALLEEIEATPLALGHWESGEAGQLRWIERPATMQELCSWQLDPGDAQTMDHLFVTRLGNLDVVPELTGTYEVLVERAGFRTLFGQSLKVAHIDELLATMTVPRRKKDVLKVQRLRQLQRRFSSLPETNGPVRGIV